MSNSTALFASLPTCVQECLSFTLKSATCEATAIPTCFCPSNAAQKTFLGCAFESCNTTELVAAFLTGQALCVDTPVQSHQKTIINVIIIMMALVVPVVLLRCLFRWRIAKRLWWDDYVMIINMIFMIPLIVTSLIAVHKGFGRHIWDLSFEQFIHISEPYELFWLGSIFYVAIQVLIKASILLFYIRVFPQRYLRIACWTMIAALLVHGLVFFFLTVFQCRPVHAIWDTSLPQSTCLSLGSLLEAGAALSIFEDVVIFLLPIAEVRKLNMDWRKKAMVLFLFSIGLLACLTSMIRLKFTIGFHRELDATYDFSDVMIWSIVEDSAAIVCACLPALKPIFSAKLLHVFGIGRKASASDKIVSSEPKVMDNGRYDKRFQWLDAGHTESSGESETATGIVQSMTGTVQSTRASEYSGFIPTKENTRETTYTEGSQGSTATPRQYDIV